jgi:hypothetical protein
MIAENNVLCFQKRQIIAKQELKERENDKSSLNKSKKPGCSVLVLIGVFKFLLLSL